MRKLLKIKVTGEDIEKGRPRNGERCPIARAAKRVLKKVSSVSEHNIIFHHTTDNAGDCQLPRAANRFVNRFDDDKTVKPFTFQVSAPVEFIR